MDNERIYKILQLIGILAFIGGAVTTLYTFWQGFAVALVLWFLERFL